LGTAPRTLKYNETVSRFQHTTGATPSDSHAIRTDFLSVLCVSSP
jgi:hypothetical protein